jgi:hypothetical protein
VRPATRHWGLRRAEWVTTAVASRMSGAANARWGDPYQARGVVGDLLGFAVFATAGLARGARLRHEAPRCLAGVGIVVLTGPRWPVAMSDRVWWAAVTAGLGGYLVVRRRGLTDRVAEA